jgi:DNA-binding CsgD family transcriptional regulator
MQTQCRTAVALAGRDGESRVLEMLPLDRGTVRSDLVPDAALAIFVAPLEQHPVPLGTIAAIYALTPTKARVLYMLAAGAPGRRIADLLSLKKAPLRPIFCRSTTRLGIHRRAELVALVKSFALPLG